MREKKKQYYNNSLTVHCIFRNIFGFVTSVLCMLQRKIDQSFCSTFFFFFVFLVRNVVQISRNIIHFIFYIIKKITLFTYIKNRIIETCPLSKREKIKLLLRVSISVPDSIIESSLAEGLFFLRVKKNIRFERNCGNASLAKVSY